MKSEKAVLSVDEVKQALRTIYERRANRDMIHHMVFVVVDRDGSVYETPASALATETPFPDKVCGQWLTVHTPMRLIGHLPGYCKQFHKCKWHVTALAPESMLRQSIVRNKMNMAQKLMEALEPTHG